MTDSFDIIHDDCRHYRGDRPCIHRRACDGCAHHDPFIEQVCVIKFASLGDVVRTLCILPELRRQYPKARITWVTLPRAARLIEDHPLIDRVLSFDAHTALILAAERFDLVLSLDKEPEPCALAIALRSDDTRGVGLNDFGKPIALTDHAAHYMRLGLSDELKFHRNRSSYPRLIHEAVGLPYRGHSYELPLASEVDQAARERLAGWGWSPGLPTLGINVGAGDVFANKMWQPDRIAQLLAQLKSRLHDTQVLLLGGPAERHIMDDLLARHPWLIHTGHDNDERSFVALVNACDVLFTGDTMAMHIAIARSKRLVVFFGPTCEQEIDLFNLGEKLIARTPCSPCYKRNCDQHDQCLDAISITHACDAIARQLDLAGRRDLSLPIVATRSDPKEDVLAA